MYNIHFEVCYKENTQARMIFITIVTSGTDNDLIICDYYQFLNRFSFFNLRLILCKNICMYLKNLDMK